MSTLRYHLLKAGSQTKSTFMQKDLKINSLHSLKYQNLIKIRPRKSQIHKALVTCLTCFLFAITLAFIPQKAVHGPQSCINLHLRNHLFNNSMDRLHKHVFATGARRFSYLTFLDYHKTLKVRGPYYLIRPLTF